MNCLKHPDVASTGTCAGCAEPFCDKCLVAIKGAKYCGDCKSLAVGKDALQKTGPTGTCEEAGQALRYAILGLLCGILFPIALVKGLNAKKIIAQNPGLEGSGKATAAIIIGAFGTILIILSIIINVLAAGARA